MEIAVDGCLVTVPLDEKSKIITGIFLKMIVLESSLALFLLVVNQMYKAFFGKPAPDFK